MREHVDGAATHELVAEVFEQHLHVRGQSRRVAGDVDDLCRVEFAQSPERLARKPWPWRIDDDDVGRSRLLDELLDGLPDIAREEPRVLDPVQLRVLDRAGNRLLGDLEAPDHLCGWGEREPDRSRAAVEVED